MKMTLKLVVMSVFALLVCVPAAFAQESEASLLPLTQPTDVGGTILEPGTYLIRVLPTKIDRNKVQITSRDRQKVYATLLTVPHPFEPNETSPTSRFVFYPPEGDKPLALRTWFARYPEASQGGHDIVYQEGRAKMLAHLANVPVVSYPEKTTVEQFETAPLSVVTPQETIVTYVPPPPAPPVVIAEVAPPPMTSAAEMPRTASNIPLMAMLGALSLAAALALRFTHR